MTAHTDTIHEEDEQPRLDWGLWRRVLIFAAPYKRRFAALSVMALLTALCEVILLILPGRLVDQITTQGGAIEPIFWAYGATILLFCSCIALFILIAGSIAVDVQFDIRAAAFAHLQKLSFSYFDQRPIGWLMARLTSDCSGLSRVIGWALLDIVWGFSFMLAITAAMFYYHWQLTLVVLAIMPPLALACHYFQIRLLVTSRRIRKANSHCTAAYNEGITGVRTSKSLVRESQNLAEFQVKTREMYDHSVQNAIYAALFLPVVILICGAGAGLALGAGGRYVILGTLTLGNLWIFYNCVAQFSNPVQELARSLTMILGAQASAERIQGLLDTQLQIVDSPAALAAKHDDAIQTVEFRAVDFAYSAPLQGGVGPTLNSPPFQGKVASASFGESASLRAERGGKGEGRTQGKDNTPAPLILEAFNLSIAPGETIALVGPTGGGKSTIVNLMCRFYEPTAGQVLINGADYRQRTLHWLQSRLGIVLQSPFLFSGTIRENIRYGRLEATDEQVEAAARTVNAHQFITRLTAGYTSQVGEGGVMLSTGQKQLISLARAILADPQVLVMDEATSSVDTETERLIQTAVERVLKGRISVVIAHRLSTIRSADRILYIDAGKIAEQGTHDQLLAAHGLYHALYTHQFTEESTQELLGV